MFIQPMFYHVYRKFSWLKLKAVYEVDTMLEPYVQEEQGFTYEKSLYGYEKDVILNVKHQHMDSNKFWNFIKPLTPKKYQTKVYSLILNRL